jgi:hypothetical protein
VWWGCKIYHGCPTRTTYDSRGLAPYFFLNWLIKYVQVLLSVYRTDILTSPLKEWMPSCSFAQFQGTAVPDPVGILHLVSYPDWLSSLLIAKMDTHTPAPPHTSSPTHPHLHVHTSPHTYICLYHCLYVDIYILFNRAMGTLKYCVTLSFPSYFRLWFSWWLWCREAETKRKEQPW